METIITNIEITDKTPKWGHVAVMNKDGSIKRHFRINATETDQINKGLLLCPVLCTPEECATGVVITSRPCNPGQAVKEDNGTLIVNYGITEVNERVTAKVVKIDQLEWQEINNAGVKEVLLNKDVYDRILLSGDLNNPIIKK